MLQSSTEAAKRLYTDTRREHPHMKLIAVEDAIASNVPHLTDLKNLDIRYIVGVKPTDHKFLFDLIKQSECIEYEHQTKDGTRHRYRYINEVQLNKKHYRFRTNFLAYWGMICLMGLPMVITILFLCQILPSKGQCYK